MVYRDVDYPKLRAVEPLPAEGDRFYVRDPEHISDAVLVVARPVLFVLSLLDGKHSLLDVQGEYARLTGEILFREKIDAIVQALDEALFLDNERFRSVQAEVVRHFHGSGTREAINAGLSYPAEGKELADYLGRLLRDGRGSRPSGREETELEAIVAPHIDLGRGGEAYGAIYRDLARRSRATRFVLLGISHRPTLHTFALTRKDYQTPLGPVKTDRDLVDRLAASCTTDFLADEIAHRDEHSIEFQMLFLRYLYGGFSELCEEREIVAVPILCSSFHAYVEGEGAPSEAGEAAELLGALGRLLGERAGDCLIAAVDFAHLGRQFGQEIEVTDAFVAQAEVDDRRMMERITARDADGFFRLIRDERDGRNVCGVPALYSLLHLLGPGPVGSIAHYGQAVDRGSHAVVTFAGIGFPRRGERIAAPRA